MSTATQRAVQTAIEAHIADELDGALLRGFVLNTIAQTVDDALLDPREGSSARNCWLVYEGQLIPMSIGLAYDLLEQLRRQTWTEDGNEP